MHKNASSSAARGAVVLAALAAALAAMPAGAADVGVSVSVGQPGFYGRIDINNRPPPPLIYPQPVIIQPAPVAVVRQPIYMRVPPGHAKNWSKHCARYAACGQPVYFVQDGWYQQQYVQPYEREHPGHGKGRGHGKGHGKGRDD